jgi:uncharacterized protein (DUF433 family)
VRTITLDDDLRAKLGERYNSKQRTEGRPMTTATSWITKTPGVCGGDACIRTTRHTVAGLVEWKRLGVSDERLLTMLDSPLTQADLDTAWAYAAEHPDEIEQAIRENAEA